MNMLDREQLHYSRKIVDCWQVKLFLSLTVFHIPGNQTVS